MASAPKPPTGQLAPELGETLNEIRPAGGVVGASTQGFRTGECFAGRYDILDRLGGGAMGEVYRARDRHVGDLVALKRIASAHITPQAVDRFRQEVRLARRIAQKNVARIYDLGEFEETFYLSMECIEGVDLERFLAAQGRLSADEVVGIALQITSGLEAAHGVDVIHRDLKPANIMCETGGRIIITDFGIATSNEDQDNRSTGEVMGSPAYMAPEQVEGGAPDVRSDLFSLGVILYELLSCTFPFTGTTPLKMAMARLDNDAHPLPDDIEISPALKRIIMGCLAREPEDRPRDAETLRRALEPHARHNSPNTTSVDPIPHAAPSAVMLRDEPTIRVRSFQYRGPDDTSYLGEGVAEELIDTLSRTRGLRVIAGAESSEQALPDSDGELTLIVNGTVERQGNRFRIVARLINGRTETQIWSEAFLVEFADLFAAQERIAQRIAEALRLEFDTAAYNDQIPRESVELYLRARQQIRFDKYFGDDGAIALLDKSLVLAPGLRPVIAWRALAVARSFWDSRVESTLTLAQAEEPVALALKEADSQAESHLAAAILAGQNARYSETVRHLTKALEVAPTCGMAHYYLGEIQCNTGRLIEGEERLRLAVQLSPNMRYVEFHLLRLEVFRGDWTGANASLHAHRDSGAKADGATLSTFLRMAMWAHRDEWLDPVARWVKLADLQHFGFFDTTIRYLRSPSDPEAFDLAVRKMAASRESVRFRALLYQILAEAHSYVGQEDRALQALEEAVGRHSFIDIDWMERSPSTLPLRCDARFQRLTEIVRDRALAVWID